jgi:hypothetical protein
MKRAFLISALSLLAASSLLAKKYFEQSPLAQNAYYQAISLRFGDAYALMAQIRLQEPDNLMVYHIENYIDFFTAYIHEDEQEYQQLRKKIDKRLQKIKEGDSTSPYYLFIQADIRLQWALVKLRFEDYLGAFSDVSKAHKLLQQNDKAFPNFMPNKKDLGILHAMVGTIPDGYKWGAQLLGGLKGTIEQGKQEIESVLAYAKEHHFIYEQETHVLYAFLLLHLENAEEQAWKAVQRGKLQPRLNPLHCFVTANIAMRTGKNDIAIEVLHRRPQGKGTIGFPYLEYMLGLAKLRRLDADAAQYFRRYLERYRGHNFVKEAYQKLAWQALINGSASDYHRFMADCEKYGRAVAGGDKNALKEAREGKTPDLNLLKARLLFDGAYYDKAYTLLTQDTEIGQLSNTETLEYYYRLGRVCHGMAHNAQAIRYYKLTLDKGQNSKYYYACNAALQLGLIYESLGHKAAARQAFEDCLKLKPDDYRVGLHQQAKSGLARLNI